MSCLAKKFLAVATALCLLSGAAVAEPIPVDPTAEGSSVSAVLGRSFCIGCSIRASLAETLEAEYFMLDVGESETFDFLTITIGALIGGAEAFIQATLAFDEPSAYVTASGRGGFITVLGLLSGGVLEWNQPGAIDLGDGTYLGVTFEDIFEGGLGNSTTVSATVSRYGTVSVAEPGVLALLGLGLLLLGMARRRTA